MAKDLPYFKFNVAEFLLGRISTETSALKGVFIDACAHYWHKECCMSRLELNAKIGKRNVGLLIDKGYITEKGLNEIEIPFLDEQRIELIKNQEKRSIAGKKARASQFEQSPSNRQSIAKHLYKEEIKIRGDKEQDKKGMREQWLFDLENSTHLETIAGLHQTTVEDVKSYIPAFRLKAELTYPSFDRLVSHFKNFVNTEKNSNKSRVDEVLDLSAKQDEYIKRKHGIV